MGQTCEIARGAQAPGDGRKMRCPNKIYDVPAEWQKRAFVDDAKYQEMYARSIKDPNGFWAEQAKRIDWIKPFTKVKNTSFDAATTSRSNGSRTARSTSLTTASTAISPSAATRPRSSGKATIPKDDKKLTYKQLHAEVCRFANVLKARGVKKGDRVTIYMPMISEAAYRDARLRAHRRHPFGGLRRLLAGLARRPHRGLQVDRRRHRRRRPARRPQDSAQGERRRRLRQGRRRQNRHRRHAHRARR